MSARAGQFIAAGIAVIAVVVAGASAIWVFRLNNRSETSSIWHDLLADRATMGFVRAAMVMLALYAIGSLAALLLGGRWIRSIGKGGIEVEAAHSVEKQVEELRERVHRAESERDRTMRLLEAFIGG